MKKLFLYLSALVVLAVSCQKEVALPTLEGNEPASQVEMVTETICGSRGVSTKSTISDVDASFSWTVGDNVAVHVSNGKYAFTTDEGASGAVIDVVHSDEASFTVVYEAGYSRDAFAVYPSTIVSKTAANYGQEGHPLDVTLPDSYTLAQVSGETSPGPMIATNHVGERWDFYQLCSLLRLTVDYIPASTKRLEIAFDGKKVCGDFSVASPVVPGTSAIETTNDASHSVITITKDGTDALLGQTSLMVNIPLPVGEYDNITITAYDALKDGNNVRTITRPFSRTTTVKMAFKRTATFPSSKKAFRGYEVSTGILERSKVGDDPATYSLTAGEMVMTYDPTTGKEIYALPAGCNPFEAATYYGKAASLNKYYNKWYTMRDELGASGSNINATSPKLPAGWQLPTGGGSQHDAGTVWGKVLFGAPQSTITVNGQAIKKANNCYAPFALVAVTLENPNGYSVPAGTYYGILVFRDGATIPSGYLNKVGLYAKYTENPLTEAQFNELVGMGCLFISTAGYYDGSWRDLNNSYQEGYYWSSTYYNSKGFYMTIFDERGNVSVASRSTGGSGYYCNVKLVKPVVD